jgi:hypothetical protein
MIGLLVTLIVYALVLGLLYWLVDYLLGVFPLPDPIGRIIRAVGLLLGFTGADYGLPRMRWRE